MTDFKTLLKAGRWAAAGTVAAATTALVMLEIRSLGESTSGWNLLHQPFIWLSLTIAALGPWWALAAVVVQIQTRRPEGFIANPRKLFGKSILNQHRHYLTTLPPDEVQALANRLESMAAPRAAPRGSEE